MSESGEARRPGLWRRLVVVVALLALVGGGAALVWWAARDGDEDDASDRALAAAGCRPDVTTSAKRQNWHVFQGEPIDYDDAPPSMDFHWPKFLSGFQLKTFFDREDRPAVETLVHSMEHGHSLVWYDETVTEADARRVASQFEIEQKIMVVPWLSSDGPRFPGGAHIALTHWTADGEEQGGVWRYCTGLDPIVVDDFLKDYPISNSPEPEGP